jgi:hypothetical protein
MILDKATLKTMHPVAVSAGTVLCPIQQVFRSLEHE